ncbi:MAG: tRNA lysidine(34) synthetase TilS [Hyphomicrobiales bacterium]|nr:tRNA lysidine(34) synthetase TilS [Hyphomicrobiales bacterium]
MSERPERENPTADRPLTVEDAERLLAPWRDARGLALAVSGGADSMALLLLAARWRDKLSNPPRIVAFTVDHGLRPEAAAEAEFVANAAAELGVEHHTLYWVGEKPTGNVQAAARKARYRLLADAAVERGLDHVVTAHHLDDQAETFMLRLARGSGVYGLAAMDDERKAHGITIARPFLKMAKRRLETTLKAASRGWIEDPSNRDARYSRVRMRQLMPRLVEEDLTAERLAATAARLRRAATALETVVDDVLWSILELHPAGVAQVDAARLMAQPEEIGLRALARLVRCIGGGEFPPRLARLEAVYGELGAACADNRRVKRTLGGAVLRYDGGTLTIFREIGRAGLPRIRLEPGKATVWDRRFRVFAPDINSPLEVRGLGWDLLTEVPAGSRAALPDAAIAAAPAFFRSDELIAAPCVGVFGGDSAWFGIASEFIGADALVSGMSDIGATVGR